MIDLLIMFKRGKLPGEVVKRGVSFIALLKLGKTVEYPAKLAFS